MKLKKRINQKKSLRKKKTENQEKSQVKKNLVVINQILQVEMNLEIMIKEIYRKQVEAI
ncbi:hypothetical protein [Clostridium sp.]|uniref:hypothetical protein n=1 Tax=Clostridium sp. TaxID=1506 RepID=UPI00293100E7|nr:hypothetical protein [Clostridium sp.]